VGLNQAQQYHTRACEPPIDRAKHPATGHIAGCTWFRLAARPGAKHQTLQRGQVTAEAVWKRIMLLPKQCAADCEPDFSVFELSEGT